MKKHLSIYSSCSMKCSALKSASAGALILFMTSLCLPFTVSAQGESSISNTDLQEMYLTAEDQEAIEALATSYSKFALAGDFESWLQLYREDAVRMIPGAPSLEGREAISQWINSMDLTVRAHKISAIEIEGTRELAFVRGTFQSELSINLGSEERIIPDEGSWLAVVRRDQQDTWRFYRFISNTDLAPAANE